jgi:Uma2 family endonuclease
MRHDAVSWRGILPAMVDPARKRATYEELLAVPEHLVAEIVDGELITSPRPGGAHSVAASAAGASLAPPFQFGDRGPGGWWILDEPELHLGQDVLVPDIAGWRKERMPGPPAAAFIELPPDWVCEVLSPSTARFDRVQKLPVYARYGVQNLWLIDPVARTLEVFRLEQQRWLLLGTHGNDEMVHAEPFEAVELDLLRLWGESR